DPDISATSKTLNMTAGATSFDLVWTGYNDHSGDVTITFAAAVGAFAAQPKQKPLQHVHPGQPEGPNGEHCYALRPLDKANAVPAHAQVPVWMCWKRSNQAGATYGVCAGIDFNWYTYINLGPIVDESPFQVGVTRPME